MGVPHVLHTVDVLVLADHVHELPLLVAGLLRVQLERVSLRPCPTHQWREAVVELVLVR